MTIIEHQPALTHVLPIDTLRPRGHSNDLGRLKVTMQGHDNTREDLPSRVLRHEALRQGVEFGDDQLGDAVRYGRDVVMDSSAILVFCISSRGNAGMHGLRA